MQHFRLTPKERTDQANISSQRVVTRLGLRFLGASLELS